MAGLLDIFGGDPQSQGLLAAAAQILQASGPSRTPTSFGQILGSGLQAGQQATQQGRQAAQLEQMRALQIKNAESDVAAQDAQRQRAQNLLSLTAAYGKQRGGQQQAPAAPVDRSAAAMFQGLMGGASGQLPRSPFMQHMDALGDSAPPAGKHGAQAYYDAAAQAGLPNPGSIETSNQLIDRVNRFGESPADAAQALSGKRGSPGATPASGASTGRGALVQQRLEYAQYLRDNGYAAEANAAEDQALKLQPKVKEWQKVNVGEQTLYAPYFEDGSSGQPVPLEVAQNLERVNAGGTTELINPSTGASVRSIANTASPDALLSAAMQRRGQDITMRGQNMVDARAVASNPGNKPLPAAALKMQQSELDALSTASGIDGQLARIQGQLEGGTLSFGPVSNLVSQARNASGMSNEASRNQASFRSTLEKLRNDSLRLNSGVQTDGDAQRAWNELFTNLNDTELVKQRLGEIRGINTRAAQLRKLNVDGIRANYGHEPLDTSRYEQPGAAPEQRPAQAQPAAGSRSVTLADIAETARKSGRSTAEVTAALKAKGYTIGGR